MTTKHKKSKRKYSRNKYTKKDARKYHRTQEGGEPHSGRKNTKSIKVEGPSTQKKQPVIKADQEAAEKLAHTLIEQKHRRNENAVSNALHKQPPKVAHLVRRFLQNRAPLVGSKSNTSSRKDMRSAVSAVSVISNPYNVKLGNRKSHGNIPLKHTNALPAETTQAAQDAKALHEKAQALHEAAQREEKAQTNANSHRALIESHGTQLAKNELFYASGRKNLYSRENNKTQKNSATQYRELHTSQQNSTKIKELAQTLGINTPSTINNKTANSLATQIVAKKIETENLIKTKLESLKTLKTMGFTTDQQTKFRQKIEEQIKNALAKLTNTHLSSNTELRQTEINSITQQIDVINNQLKNRTINANKYNKDKAKLEYLLNVYKSMMPQPVTPTSVASGLIKGISSGTTNV